MPKKTTSITPILLVTLVAMVGLFVLSLWFSVVSYRLPFLIPLTVLTTLLTAMVATLPFLYVVRRHPTSLVISMLGTQAAGKTVYVTVLFNQLSIGHVGGMTFSQYGSETVEMVHSNLSRLAEGKWLPSTPPLLLFPFRAIVRMGSGFFKSVYRIEIGDFAGQHMHEFDASSEHWLHKTKYFDYVIQSDIVFLVIDMALIVKADRIKTAQLQNAFKAAFQILLEKKGVQERKKTRTPVAILLMKSDLCGTSSAKALFTRAMPELRDLCQNRCAHFAIFPVSSIGKLGKSNSPPQRLKPVGVVEPLAWALRSVEL